MTYVKPTFYCIFVSFNSQIVQFNRNVCNEMNELDHKTDLNDSLTNKCEGFVHGSIKSIRVIRESSTQ